ncbi:hypothetical protein [Kaistella palustris]|uniref:hypothetical protein n=1 Tax=Kaistella palustris TaxID=493376 RepID=UPI00041AF970|nr:hypothetical protein [Kaistella palustris]
MTNLDKLNNLFDAYLLERKKSFLTLRTGKELIKNSNDPEIQNLDLKKILESGLIKNSSQTAESPRQWRIFISAVSESSASFSLPKPTKTNTIPFDNPIKYDLKTKRFTTNTNSSEQNNNGKIALIATGAILLFIYLFSMNNAGSENVYQSKYVDSNSTDYSSSQTRNSPVELLHKFTSNSNDLENMSGVIKKTNNEMTTHVFDFKNKVVTCYRPVNGKYQTLKYTMKNFYKEEGIAATTYVIQVSSRGVKEIWFSPDVPNLGYDYDDGTRRSFYGLTKINAYDF